MLHREKDTSQKHATISLPTTLKPFRSALIVCTNSAQASNSSYWPKSCKSWRSGRHRETMQRPLSANGNGLRGGFEISCQACSSSSKRLASFKSRVSKPSVNHLWTVPRRSRASDCLP